MSAVKIVTDPDRLEEIRRMHAGVDRVVGLEGYLAEAVAGGKSSSLLIDQGRATVFELLIELDPSTTIRQHLKLYDQVAVCVASWLHKKSERHDASEARRAAEDQPPKKLRLPSGNLHLGSKSKIVASKDPVAPTRIRTIRFEDKLPALSFDRNELDEELLGDMRDMYEAIVCEIGSVRADVTVGTHQYVATMEGNVSEFKSPAFGVTFVPEGTTD